jgi:hypothetical protein
VEAGIGLAVQAKRHRVDRVFVVLLLMLLLWLWLLLSGREVGKAFKSNCIIR